MIQRDAPVSDIIRELNQPDFDPIRVINSAVNDSKPLKEQQPASVELMVTLNDYSHTLSEALQQALENLRRTEKRIPHEINLLHNDVSKFNDTLSEEYGQITDLVNFTRRSSVLEHLNELQLVRSKLTEVKELLELAGTKSLKESSLSAEQINKLAVVLQGTPDEAKWNTEQQSYYDLINKMIN